MISDFEELQRHLSKTHKVYLNLEPIGSQSVHLRFTGRYNNQDVVWDASFITLEKYYQELLQSQISSKDETIGIQQFIEIDDNGENGIPLKVDTRRQHQGVVGQLPACRRDKLCADRVNGRNGILNHLHTVTLLKRTVIVLDIVHAIHATKHGITEGAGNEPPVPFYQRDLYIRCKALQVFGAGGAAKPAAHDDHPCPRGRRSLGCTAGQRCARQ